ncbi:unnamed protein product, partial [Owenia fusiformis]
FAKNITVKIFSDGNNNFNISVTPEDRVLVKPEATPGKPAARKSIGKSSINGSRRPSVLFLDNDYASAEEYIDNCWNQIEDFETESDSPYNEFSNIPEPDYENSNFILRDPNDYCTASVRSKLGRRNRFVPPPPQRSLPPTPIDDFEVDNIYDSITKRKGLPPPPQDYIDHGNRPFSPPFPPPPNDLMHIPIPPPLPPPEFNSLKRKPDNNSENDSDDNSEDMTDPTTMERNCNKSREKIKKYYTKEAMVLNDQVQNELRRILSFKATHVDGQANDTADDISEVDV